MCFYLLLAGPDCSRHYQPHQLDAADALRCQQHPALAQRADWRSSRFLKQQQAKLPAQMALQSLSHSGGHAALLCGTGVAGVDLEYMRQRDFAALLAHCARDEEIQWWQQQADGCMAFYRLWTLKEALIKAAQLDFPADLHRVGLFRLPENGWQAGILGHNGQLTVWQHLNHAISSNIMLACVWPQQGAPRRLLWQGYGQTDWRLPVQAEGMAVMRENNGFD